MSTVFNLSFMVDFRLFGGILCLIAMVLLLATFYHYANKYDHVSERRQRQAERLKSLIEQEKQETTADIAEVK